MRITTKNGYEDPDFSAWMAGDLFAPPPREWLDCDGGGGYASSTLFSFPVRKYHGLLVANLPAPAAGRHVLVSGSVEEVRLPGGQSLLASGYLPADDAGPSLPEPADVFSTDPVPTWRWDAGSFRLRRRVFVLRDGRSVVIQYERADRQTDEVTVAFRPLLAYRRNHALSHANPFLKQSAEIMPEFVRLQPYDGMPPLTIGCSQWVWTSAPHWVRVRYPEEEHRGYAAVEDLFVPGEMQGQLGRGDILRIVMTARDAGNLPTAAEIAEELRFRRDRLAAARCFAARSIPAGGRTRKAFLTRLARAADDFLIRTPDDRPTVQAGYHWFEDWGRDACIALPGLTFARGLTDEGWEILRSFLALEREGLLPNFIGPPGAAPAYNSVDAALWAFRTVQEYLAWGGNPERVREEAWPVLQRIIDRLAEGAPGPVYGIGMTSDGLLQAGTPETQLTWMDATVGARPVTPRYGLAVEVCALWYNALRFAERFAAFIGEPAAFLPVEPERVRQAFLDTFVLPEGTGLADVVNDEGVDATVRPNQIIACSVPESPLDASTARRVIETVRRRLWTPRGLRTLPPDSPRYRSRYGGGPDERDAAYHQGTVWPWLLGPFWEAELRWNDWSPRMRKRIRREMRDWESHLREAGVGSVSEVFDGDLPQRPRGCIAQAWSVAEILRLHILVEKGPLPCGYC